MIISVQSFGQFSSTLVGITRTSSPSKLYLSQLNTFTGGVTNISPLSFSSSYSFQSLSTLDPTHNVFYLLSSRKLLGINLSSGSIITNISITTPFPSNFELMQFNSMDSTLYGITRNTTNQDLFLSKLDPMSGQVSTISTTAIARSYSLYALATIDPGNNIFYIISSSKLIGIDLKNGNIVTSTPLPIASATHFELMRFNVVDSTLYGVTRNLNTQELYLTKINPGTGLMTIISSSAFAKSFTTYPLVTIDPVKGVFYMQSQDKVLGVSLSSGDVITSAILTTPTGRGRFELMCFNPNAIISPMDAFAEEMVLVKVYPNPFKESTTIDFENPQSKILDLFIYNALGQLIFSRDNITTDQIRFERANWPNGLYTLQLWADKQCVSKGKMIIE
jgi:hypothetical protein